MSMDFLDKTVAARYRSQEDHSSLADLPDGLRADIRLGLLVATKEGEPGAHLLVKQNGKPLVSLGADRPLASLPVSSRSLKNALTAVASDKGSCWRWFHRVDINVNEGLRKFLGVKAEAGAKRQLDADLKAKLRVLGPEFRALLFSLLCHGRLTPQDGRLFIDTCVAPKEGGGWQVVGGEGGDLAGYMPLELRNRLLAQKNLPSWLKQRLEVIPSPLLDENTMMPAPNVDEDDPLLRVVGRAPPPKPETRSPEVREPIGTRGDSLPTNTDFWVDGPGWAQAVLYEKPLKFIHDKIGPTTAKWAALASLCGIPGHVVGLALGVIFGGICALGTLIFSGGNTLMAKRMFSIVLNTSTCVLGMLFFAWLAMGLVAAMGSIGLLFPKKR